MTYLFRNNNSYCFPSWILCLSLGGFCRPGAMVVGTECAAFFLFAEVKSLASIF